MAQIEVLSEREDGSGWCFDVQVLDDEGALRRHEVRLSWADYNLWSASGRDEPARVAEAVVLFLASRSDPASLRETFDASLARRLFPEADTKIPRMI